MLLEHEVLTLWRNTPRARYITPDTLGFNNGVQGIHHVLLLFVGVIGARSNKKKKRKKKIKGKMEKTFVNKEKREEKRIKERSFR